MFPGLLLLLAYLLCGFASPLLLAGMALAWYRRYRQPFVRRMAGAGLAGALLVASAYLLLGLALDAEGGRSLLGGLFSASAGFTVGALCWLAWTLLSQWRRRLRHPQA